LNTSRPFSDVVPLPLAGRWLQRDLRRQVDQLVRPDPAGGPIRKQLDRPNAVVRSVSRRQDDCSGPVAEQDATVPVGQVDGP